MSLAVTCALAALLALAAQSPPAGPHRLPRFGAGTLDEARRTGKPVLLLAADEACARCRADEDEAMADARAAALLGSAFVAARIERVERPELDALLATAVQWLSGERGHPMALALLPDGRPFAGRAPIGGDDRAQSPGLHRFALRAWSEFTHDRASAEARAAATADALARAQSVSGTIGGGGGDVAASALRGLQEAFDARLGGFGAGVAFAPAAALRLLLASLEAREDAAVRRMLERTLDAVALAEKEPESLARRAVLLEAFARATRLSDSALYRQRAAALAEGARALQEADGAFAAYGEGGMRGPVVAGWNGVMIGALALSGRALDRPQDVQSARRAAAAVLQRLGPAARLKRGAGAAGAAPLEDHAWLAEGLLRLDAALWGREPRWAVEAAALVDAAVGHYYDPLQGGFFDAVSGPDAFVPASLPQRLRSAYEGELPSANGVMAAVLARLARALSQPRYAELAQLTLDAFAGDMRRAPRGLEGLAAASLEARPAAPAGGDSEGALPAREVRDGITFAAEVAPAGKAAATLRLRIEVPRGTYVVAHEPGARDLVGLSLSVPTPGVSAEKPRYGAGRRLDGRWHSGVVNVHSGTTEVDVALRLTGPAPPVRVRARVVFQVCRDEGATCDRPQSLLLEAPLRQAPP